MGGTLLQISRNPKSKSILRKKELYLKEFLSNNFQQYFQNITFLNPDENSLIVQFKIDNKEKFYKDNLGNWLLYEGTVFALNETKEYTCRDLLSLYKKFGDEFTNLLDGTFVIKLFDKKNNSYKIINDFIKNKTNYIVSSEDFIQITPYLITSALVKEPKINQYALNEFMWRYYILSGSSIFQGVEKLQPASIYTFSNNTLTNKQYWSWPKQYTDLSFKDSVEKTVTSMKESARLISSSFGKPCIDFTMGQDSRQVISSFRGQKLPFTTAIFGRSDFLEVKKVGEMSEKLNIDNNNIQLEDNYYNGIWNVFSKALLLGNAEQPGHMLGRILYLKEQYKKFGNVSLNGIDGHFYKNGLWDEQYLINFYREPKSFNIPLFLKLRALSKKFDDNIFNDEFLKIKSESKDYFYQLIKKSISGYEDSPVSIQIDKFDLTHWLNFGLAANSATNSIIPHISPLLLRRNLEFALQVPVKWKFNLSKYQREVVYQMDSIIAAEKTDFGGVNMVPKNFFTYFPFYFRYFNFQSSRFRNKIKSKLGFKVITHLQEAWNYLSIYEKFYETEEQRHYSNAKHLIDSGIINEDNWKTYLSSFSNTENRNLNNFEYLFKITGLEFFLSEADKLWKMSK